jgi:4-amino-4-deoxy-L-arabinose transferase-like glycosyltransferase
MTFALTARERAWLAWFVVAIVALRILTLGAYPLMDTTESRYAEIARKMLETGDWLTPQFDYGVPFWGKPPLSTWLSAMSMAAFGVNEFAARLPSLALLAGCGALVYALAAQRGGRDQALWTLALFAGTAMLFVASGATMTDPALMLGTTLSMAGFWFAVNGAERHRCIAGYAFFAGLCIGLLAKGPVAVVLVLVPVGASILWTRSLRTVWQRLPWIRGLLVATALAGAWYWAAERATPGFLEYFLIGEHWKRFVEPGWTGDLYGAAHKHPRGLIWLLWIAAALPWSVGALVAIARRRFWQRETLRAFASDPWRVYFALWAVTPMVFFTPARNILITYVLPGLPAFALLLGDAWRPHMAQDSESPEATALRPAVVQALAAGAAVPAVFVAGLVLLHGALDAERSQKALVHAYAMQRSTPESPLIYFRDRPDSAAFYALGTAQRALDAAALHARVDAPAGAFFAIRDRDLAQLPPADRAQLEEIGAYGDFRLLRNAPR